MKTLALVAVVIANLLLLTAAVLAALSPQVHEVGRVASGVAAACTVAVVAMLIGARMVALPQPGRRAFPWLSLATVVAWTAGSVGPGAANAKVAGFLVLVAIVAAGGWFVFRRLQAPPA